VPSGGSRNYEADFFSDLKGNRIALTLVNGEKVTATFRGVCKECLLVEDRGKRILIYRHAIITVRQASGDEKPET